MKKNSTRRESSKQGVKGAKTRQGSITIGMDLGDKASCCCAIDESGEVLFERSVATTKKGMAEMFGALSDCRIALEVGTHSPWVSRLLASFGHEVIVAHARQLKLISQSTRKHDKLDARSLARLARIDAQLLRPIRHRSEQAQLDLMQIRVRAELVEVRTSLINAGRGMAKAAGERLPNCDADTLTVERMQWLPAAVRQVLEPLLQQVAGLTEQMSCSKSAEWVL